MLGLCNELCKIHQSYFHASLSKQFRVFWLFSWAWAFQGLLDTANLRTKIIDFRRFDSSIILILRGGIPRPIGNLLESLSQAILAGRVLVGRLGMRRGTPELRPPLYIYIYIYIYICIHTYTYTHTYTHTHTHICIHRESAPPLPERASTASARGREASVTLSLPIDRYCCYYYHYY